MLKQPNSYSWMWPKTSTQSRHSVRTVRTHRSANAFPRGARIGLLTMLTPSDRKISSKGPENFASRDEEPNAISRSPIARFPDGGDVCELPGGVVLPNPQRHASWLPSAALVKLGTNVASRPGYYPSVMGEKATFIGLRLPAAIGVLVVLPFATLEWATRSHLPRSTFPPIMFFVMWLVAAVVVLILTRMMRMLRAGNLRFTNLGFLAVQGAVVIFITWSWMALVVDQMPCFLGATGC